jgi:hypothetical protein
MGHYGKQHTTAKHEKLAGVLSPKCEVTNSTGKLECHHVVPKSFTGPDMKNNYILLKDTFHGYLHYCVNVKEQDEQFYRRLGLAKRLWNDPLGSRAESTHKELDVLDKLLIPIYIQNTMNKLQHNVRDKVLELTLISNYETIRDLTIKVHQLEAELQQVRSGIESYT